MQVYLDANEKTYTISVGRSSVVMSFKYVFEASCELARRLKLFGEPYTIPLIDEIGSETQLNYFQSMRNTYLSLNDSSLWFDGRTPFAVKSAIQSLTSLPREVRIFYGDKATGLDWICWGEPLIGFIGVTEDEGFNLPTLYASEMDDYGVIIDSEHIVKIVDIASNEVIYSHSKYHLPLLEMIPLNSDNPEGKFQVFSCNGDSKKLESTFNCSEEAIKLIQFLKGNIHQVF